MAGVLENRIDNQIGIIPNAVGQNLPELFSNATSDELANGCRFADKFKNRDAVERNGGTIFGAPVVNNGIELDGTNDYVKYVLNGEFNSPQVSIAVDFSPDFNWDIDALKHITDTESASRYLIYKHNNSSGNTIVVMMNSIAIANIPSATYSAHWNQGERNVLVVSAESGDNNVWLNGVQILTSGATAWSAGNPLEFYIGSNFLGSKNFDGTINSFCIYQSKLTAKAAEDLYNYGAFKNAVELVADPNMENAGVGDWAPGNSALLSKESNGKGGQALKVERNGANTPFAQPSGISLVAGCTYEGVVELQSDGVTTMSYRNGGTVIESTTSTDWEEFKYKFLAVGTTVNLAAVGATIDGQYGRANILSIKESNTEL
jgi:hypothetical protein